jgi:DnaJ-domain-containing protein 1
MDHKHMMNFVLTHSLHVILVGTAMGVTQVVRGVKGTPEAITAPAKGKWWDENTGKWVYTNLVEDAKSLEGVPIDDSDLLEEIEKDIDLRASTAGGTVKDPYYYDILEVDPKADTSAIKRKYYVLARKYHPDKVGKDDKEAAEKFKDIAEAYQVLSDPQLRAKYDMDGREGLSADKTEVADNVPKVDPAILFAFLFGSDRFDDYVGRLATATSASVGDSPNVSMTVAREIQKRRVTRLAVKLAAKLQGWVDEDYDLCKTMWKTEAEDLSTASYGIEMVHTIGKVRSIRVTLILSGLDTSTQLFFHN